MKVLFDTSILIDSLKGYRRASKLIETVSRREVDGVISVISEAELSNEGYGKQRKPTPFRGGMNLFPILVIHA